jgi:hypothetical protein
MKPYNTLIVCSTIIVLTILVSIVQCSREETTRPRTCTDKARELYEECDPFGGGRVETECVQLSETALKECYAHGSDTDGQ